ncbi:outer membrane protein assembly factor BamB [Mizugakiibacter sediminis]|nr:outer membrane protein assembly factor BamB [Mizugakiibacter sediminis]GAP66966.1 outer membrane protein assembly factor BamB [Mizugakiibacter sediminis]
MKRGILILALAALVAGGGCSAIKRAKRENIQPPRELTEITPTIKVERLWKTSVGDGAGKSGIRMRPAYAAGVIYAAGTDGVLLALDAKSGKTLWKHRAGWHLFGRKGKADTGYAGGPTVSGDLLAVGTLDGHVYAFGAADGKPRWEAQLNSEVIAAPAIAGNLVLVRTEDGHVTALDAANGERKWVYDRGQVPPLSLRGNGDMVVAGGGVFFGTDDGKIEALRIETGVPQWEQVVASSDGRTEIERLNDSDGMLVLDGAELFATAYHGQLVDLQAPTGRPLWNRAFSSYTGPDVSGTTVVAVDEDSNVWAFDRNTGSDLWKQDALLHRWLTAPAIQQAHVVVGDLQGYVHWLDLADGKIAARERLSRDAIRARPLVVGDTVYVEDVEGHLAAYRVVGQ